MVSLGQEISLMQNLFQIENKVILVTGGSRGIGYMIAEGFVAFGSNRVYICSRKKAEVEKAAETLSQKGPGTCIAVIADLSKKSDIQKLVDFIQEKEGHLDILINNAGANWAMPIEEFTDDAFQKVMQLNLNSVFSLTRSCLPLLLKNASNEKPSRIINISSINGIHPPAFNTFSYSASKAGLNMLTQHLAIKLAPKITVNAVLPGSFPSKMMKQTLEQFGDVIKSQVPMQRIGKPSDMQGVCIWLCSDSATYVNGSLIVVDGGASLTTGYQIEDSKL